MKIKTKEWNSKTDWHKWYAWHPIWVYIDGQKYMICFEYVLRKRCFAAMDCWCEYKTIEGE